jgi:hypothetical protein
VGFLVGDFVFIPPYCTLSLGAAQNRPPSAGGGSIVRKIVGGAGAGGIDVHVIARRELVGVEEADGAEATRES